MTANQNPFGLWSNPLLAAVLLTVWITLLLIFNGEPQWDLAISGWHFDPQRCAATANGRFCGGFAAAGSPVLVPLREAMQVMPVVIGIVLLFLGALDHRDGMRWRHAGLRIKLVLPVALIVGPGLIVNGVLKEFWGRPRPWMTEAFGGWMPFVEAGAIQGMCERNCSFVSGEGAGAGWLLCLTVLFPPELRRPAFAVLALIGATMAYMRVMFGAHYFSDALLGYLLSVTVFVALAALAQSSMRAG